MSFEMPKPPLPAAEREPVPTKAEVVAALAANPEDFSLLNRYLDTREAEGKTSADTLALNIEAAEIYRDAGMAEAAYAAFLDAAEQAQQELKDDLYKQLKAEANKLTW